MSISVTCSCGKRLRTAEKYAGRKARCPNCGEAITFPRPAPVDSATGPSDPSTQSQGDEAVPRSVNPWPARARTGLALTLKGVGAASRSTASATRSVAGAVRRWRERGKARRTEVDTYYETEVLRQVPPGGGPAARVMVEHVHRVVHERPSFLGILGAWVGRLLKGAVIGFLILVVLVILFAMMLPKGTPITPTAPVTIIAPPVSVPDSPTSPAPAPAPGPSTATPGDVATVSPGGDPADYSPPSRPRSEARYGRLYLEIRDASKGAGEHADRVVPRPADLRFDSTDAERQAWIEADLERNKKWNPVFDKELNRLWERIASREGISLDELHDIRAEGDVRGWWVEHRKRDRFKKTEAQMLDELRKQREFLAASRNSERAERQERQGVEKREADRKLEHRAAVLMQIARNLEKSGKGKAALETYRRIAKDFPATPQAKTAAGRIAALEPE